MTLTTCIKKAGSALHEDDKSAILAAARKYRKDGLSADDAGRKAVADQIAEVQGMLEGAGNPTAAGEKKSGASLPDLIKAYKDAKEKERALADAKNVNLSDLARAVDATRSARAPLVAKLAEQPALAAKNSNGLLRIVAGSAQKPGHWQLTRFDQNSEPWGDSQYTTQESAIDDFLREVEIDTLETAPAPTPAQTSKTPTIDERKSVAPGEVADKFGESLPPARRAMAAKLDEDLSDDDIAKRPLSEIWPLAENEAIEDTFAAAVAHAARAEVPAKPRQPYKLRRWVEKVKSVRELAGKIVSGRVTREAMIEQINTQHRSLKDWLSKVLLLEQIQRDQWKRIGSVEERPDAFTYEDGKQVPSPMLRLEVDGKAQWLRGDSGVQGEDRGTVEGNKAAILAMLAGDAPDKRMEFEIRGKSGGPYKINKKGDPEYRPLMTFPTVEEARRAINVDYDSLAAAWEAVKARDNITERDLRNAENRPRSGKDHRGGKDVDAQKFQDTFGFRGGEFGKWVQQGKGDKERQALLNSAYDALMDLSDIVGVPPRAISLNGTLGIAFGSRGSGWASAHFEPSNLVINLTKTRGAGSLAHEWLHALDNYFGRMRRGGEEAKFTGDKKKYHAENFITHRPEPLMVRKDRARGYPLLTLGQLEARRQRRKEGTRTGWPPEDAYDADKWERDPATPEGVRPEVERAFADLVAELNASPMAKRAQTLDKGRDGYWSSTLEMAARAFESFVMARMHESGYHNDFLVNVKKAEDVAKDPARYPYLMAGEIKPIADAFGALFDTIQTRETEGGNVAMFSRATPFIATDTSDGFPTYANAEAGIDLSFPQKAERFEVIDVPGDVVNYAIMPLDSIEPFGYVELLVQNGRPVSLLDIEVTPQGRRNGIGRKVIETLLAANPGVDLEISNIVPEARGFWARMGVPEQNVEGAYDGTLNWQTYSEAQDSGPADRAAQAGRGARAKRDAGAERSPSAPGGQVPQGLTRAEAQAMLAALESAQSQILTRPVTAERAREIAQAMGATVNVVQSVDEIPAAKRESLLAQAPDGRVRGAFFRDDASVWLVLDNVHSEAEAAFVILHEAFHRGLAATIGPDAKRLLRQMYLTNPRLNQLAREQMKMHGIGQDEAIEEALADLAGRGQVRDLRGWPKLLEMIRGWLSKVGQAIGLDIKWSDDMVEDFVAGIAKAGLQDGVHVAGDVKASQAEPQAKWYSALRLEVAAANIKSAPATAWTQYLDALVKKGAVKADEVEWTGLREWLGLQPGKITREQVGQFLAGNGVQVTETVLGSAIPRHMLPSDWTVERDGDGGFIVVDEDGEMRGEGATEQEAMRDAADPDVVADIGSVNGMAKYGQYTLPGGPLSRDTEILSRDGWLRMDEVQVGDIVMTRRDEDGCLEWQEVEAVPTVFADKLYHFKNQSINMRVTACHNMLVKRRRRSSAGLFRAKAAELWGMAECVAPLVGEWHGKATADIYGYRPEDAAELIGWYIAEGSAVTEAGKKSTLAIAQSREANPEKCARIEALLSRMGIAWNYVASGPSYYLSIKTMDRGLVDVLHAQGGSRDKFVPAFIFDQPPAVLRSLMDGMLLGDGHLACVDDPKREPRWAYFTNCKSLADDMQLLALLCGLRATIGQRPTGLYEVRLNSKQWASIDDAKHAIVDYNDTAFCVTVKNHAIYVRTGGVAAFTGNSNYREVLLTLPTKSKWASYDSAGNLKAWLDGEPTQAMKDAAAIGGGYLQRTMLTGGAGTYQSGHWDQPNVLAHIRVNDRVDSDGKRVLFVEEIQSDWGQQGKKDGFKANISQATHEIVPMKTSSRSVEPDGFGIVRKDDPDHGTSDIYRTRAEAEAALRAGGQETGGVPAAPFVGKTDKWVSLALKRIVKMAVDGGYDKVAFIAGEQSAERYDLSKQIERVIYLDNQSGGVGMPRMEGAPGRGSLEAYDHEGRRVVDQYIDDPAKIEDYVGKEVAQRLLDAKPRASQRAGIGMRERALQGLDLKVGGEGMKAFYDRIVPSVLKDVLRKVGGGQMGVVDMRIGKEPENPAALQFQVDHPEIYSAETRRLAAQELVGAKSQQPGFTITPAMREKAAGGMPLFSRAAPIKSAQDLVSATDGIFDFNRLGETRQDRVRTIVDGSRPFWLGALTRDQIADIYGDEISPVREYDVLTRAMENQRSKIAQDADTLYREWSGLDSAANNKLSRLMLDATVNSVHPDGSFTSMPSNDAETEAWRRAEHQRLQAEFKALPADAQAMYRKVRDFHAGMLEQLRDALAQRIQRQVQDGQARAAALTALRLAFDRYSESGPYFPLSRFGDFLVIGTRPDGERVVASYATAGEQQSAARALRKDGFTVKLKTAKDYSRSLDGSAGKFAGDVLDMLANLDMDEAMLGGQPADLKTKLLDDVNQMFIRALPDLSYRKHFIHRKNTPGFSSDMMRGFASSAFHAASHIARLNHADRMSFALEDAFKTVEQLDEGDFNQQTQVLNELAKRHDAAMNPNTHPIAAMLNQVGFVMYLGASPAAGLVNLLQTPMVTLPYLGARHGFGKATSAMAKATRDIMGAKPNKSSGWNAADSLRLTVSERETMKKLQDEGVIDLTQAHDLSAATGLDTGNVARSKAAFAMSRAMRIVGWTFHVPEVMNRQVTALSAYRLEMQASGDQAKAETAAREAIKRTHFDYSASNRARYMQGNVARVLLQFKQYAQNMTYLLGRAAYVAMKDADPEVRAIARRQLVATLGATFAMAGALGLPGVGAAAGLIGALVAAVDDDDKPWDWKVEFRNLMADTFGKEAGEVLSHGLPRALVPWEISNRVGMGELWFRSNDREGQSPREAFATDMANILGPTAGSVLGLYTAADHMARGNWAKAAESMVPKFIRDPIQAGRIASEGVTSYTGEHLMDVTEAEVLGKLLGFTPARASEMYEGRNAVKNAETVVMERRKLLIGRAARARIDSDSEELQDVMEDIAEFNRRNPAEAIKSESIAASVLARMRHQRQTQDGTYLPKNRDHLREIGRFASVE